VADWSLRFASPEQMRAELDRYRSAKSETLEAEFPSRAAAANAPVLGLERASERLRAVLDELPEYGPARAQLSIHLTRRALIALNRGKLQAGHRFASEAQTLAPGNADTHYALGISLMRLERADEATPHFERAVALRPDHWPSHYGLAMARDQVGQLSEAIASLQRALELNPDDARMQEAMARLQSLRAQR
jgi:tetratricopeptide (TPR) repeat protein